MNTQLNDRQILKKLREEINIALQAVVDNFPGLTSLEAGNCKFDASGTEATFQLKATAQSPDGKSKAQIDFERYGFMYGLTSEQFGATFTSHGETWKVVGIAPSRSKYPILATNAAGKRMAFTQDIVKKLS